MSKNLTRKGLALGALVALSSTLIAGTPASAADEVVFAPSTGTSYNTFITEGLTLNASLAAGQVASNIAQLKYQVVGTTTGVRYQTNADTAAATTTATQVVAPAVTPVAGVAQTIKISAPSSLTATSDSTSVVVTAFIDSNNNSALDAGEWAQARTLGFKKYADVVSTVALTTPRVGDTSVKATIDLGDINVQQLTASDLTTVVTATSQNPGSATLASGVYTTTVTALAATNVVTARASFKTVALGSAAVSATVAARTISQPTSAVVAGVNAISNGVVRTNGAFAVAATVKDVATPAVVKAGVAVSAAITTSVTLSSTKTLSINGTVYNGSVALPTALALTTDAAGLAVVNVVPVGFAANDTITVTYKAENYTTATTATQTDATFSVTETTASGSAYRSIVEGGSTVLNYSVADQFGVAISAGRLVSTVGYTTSATVYTVLSAGAGSLTVTDTTASTATSIAVSTTVETQNATTGNWSSLGLTASAQTVTVASAANAFDATVATTHTAAIATNVALAPASGSLSVNNAGASVTVSATGVTFTSNGKEYADTVTIVTGASGDFAVSAKSNTVGAKVITFTTGTATATTTLTVSAAAASAGKTLTITAPTTSLPGRTVPVVVTLVDAYGNPVDTTSTTTDGQVTVTVSGIGTYTTVAADTDSAGKISFNVILPSTDSGSVTVTAKYDSNGATTDVSGTTVVTTVTSVIVVGTPDAVAKVGTANGRVYVNVKDGKGSVVSVKIGSKWTTKTALNNDYTFSFKNTKGKKVAVKVYVDGDLSAAKTITVK